MMGLSGSWLAIGLTTGAFLNYLIFAPRLRMYTEVAKNAITLPVLFENRFPDRSQLLKLVTSVFILVFFTFYTSAGMVSGGRLFESAFGMDYSIGLWVTSLVVVFLSLFTIGVAIFSISFFEPNRPLLEIAFECFSAYSTVGLSLGVTSGFVTGSKVVLIIVMFVGRVTMLSVLIAFIKKVKYTHYRYAQEELTIY